MQFVILKIQHRLIKKKTSKPESCPSNFNKEFPMVTKLSVTDRLSDHQKKEEC